MRHAELVEQRIGFQLIEHPASLAVPSAEGLGCAPRWFSALCRPSAAAIASAQASGVWKFGTPASDNRFSASGASGTRNAAIGFREPALSTIGFTARSG